MSGIPKVLIVEDERALSLALAAAVRHAGASSELAPTAAQARQKLEGAGPFDAMILDIGLPDQSGLAFLESLPKSKRPPTLVITAHGEIENAIAARQLGVREFFSKPLDFESFLGSLARLFREMAPAEPVSPSITRESVGTDGAFIGAAPAMRAVFQQVAQACASEEPVMIRGETGTGKTHVARLIRRQSGIPADQMVIVEDVGALSPGRQVDLLGRIESAEAAVPRVLATCGMDLLEAVARGEFRSDLYYRLQVLEVRLPPLRERLEDLPVLTSFFAGQLAPDRLIEMTDAALKRLSSHDWPGNLRELRNVMSYALTAAAGATRIDLPHLPDYLARVGGGGGAGSAVTGLTDELRRELARWIKARLGEDPLPTYRELADAIESELLRDLLGHFDGKLARLASEMKANRATLRRKLKGE